MSPCFTKNDHHCPVPGGSRKSPFLLLSRLESLNSSMESLNGEQIKTVVEERTDENGRRIRVTRKIRMRLVQEALSPAVAERRVPSKSPDPFLTSFRRNGPSLALLLARSRDPTVPPPLTERMCS